MAIRPTRERVFSRADECGKIVGVTPRLKFLLLLVVCSLSGCGESHDRREIYPGGSAGLRDAIAKDDSQEIAKLAAAGADINVVGYRNGPGGKEAISPLIAAHEQK